MLQNVRQEARTSDGLLTGRPSLCFDRHVEKSPVFFPFQFLVSFPIVVWLLAFASYLRRVVLESSPSGAGWVVAF